jgi:histidinol-phosphate aminotransferase
VNPSDFVRANIRTMAGYVPGEQPRDGSFIKLNTNENPYPPSPRVFEALRDGLTSDRLRKYPDPSGTIFRQAASHVFGIDPDAILCGNGSDDILTIITRTFVPQGGRLDSLAPSYLLYRTLSQIQGTTDYRTIPFNSDWSLPDPWPVKWADLTLLANPNSPSGSFVPPEKLRRWAEQVGGPVVIDEAYVDFANDNALALAKLPNVIVSRTLSKSYSLAGIRFGFAVADPALVREMFKVKDSYNCDVLSLLAATAAIQDQDYLLETRAKILATRNRMTIDLRQLGFDVTDSQSNFVWCRRSDRPVKPIYEELKRRMILVRYMNYEGYGEGLRISVGLDGEIDKLLDEVKKIV